MAIYGQAFRQRDRMEATAARRAEWVEIQAVAPRGADERVDAFVTRVYRHYTGSLRGATQFSRSDTQAVLDAIRYEPRTWDGGVILGTVDEDGEPGGERLILQIVSNVIRRKAVTFLTVWESPLY